MEDTDNTLKSVEAGIKDSSKKAKNTKAMTLRTVFSLEHIKNSFGVVFKRREDGSRHFIIMIIVLFGMYTYANTGTTLINLTYAKKMFHWNNEVEFNNWWAVYFSVTQLCQAFGIGAVMPVFTQVLKLNDLVITVICVSSFMLGMITIMLATNANLLFIAAGLQIFASLATTSIRAALSKIVCSKDIGKVCWRIICSYTSFG